MKVHILIVDDEEEIREMLSRHFRFLGYCVSTAANGVDALKIMDMQKTDVVISDIKMPVMDGTELCARIRSEFPLTRVIMITGYVTLDNAMTCLRRGADTCVFKPFEDLSDLDHAVNSAVGTLQSWVRILSKLKEKSVE